MTRFTFNLDLVAAKFHGDSVEGIANPNQVEEEYIRFDGNEIIDASKRNEFSIDPLGRKRLTEMADAEWPVIKCKFSDELIQTENGWRVKTDADRQQEAAEKAKDEFVSELRQQIAKDVADTESLLGTVSDATGLLIAIALADVVAMSSNTSFADYRKAKLDTLKLLSGDADIATLAGSALTQIKDGDAVLTASLKGLDNVIDESLTRSTAVATILSQAAQQPAPSE